MATTPGWHGRPCLLVTSTASFSRACWTTEPFSPALGADAWAFFVVPYLLADAWELRWTVWSEGDAGGALFVSVEWTPPGSLTCYLERSSYGALQTMGGYASLSGLNGGQTVIEARVEAQAQGSFLKANGQGVDMTWYHELWPEDEGYASGPMEAMTTPVVMELDVRCASSGGSCALAELRLYQGLSLEQQTERRAELLAAL